VELLERIKQSYRRALPGETGVHIKVVQERLGHSSIRVTLDTYSHVIGGLQEAAAQRFDDLLAARGIENVGKAPGGCW